MISDTWLIIGLNTLADVSSGFGIYTYFYYKQFHYFWWNPPKPKLYSISFDSEKGLTVSLGKNPIKGLMKLWRAINRTERKPNQKAKSIIKNLNKKMRK